MKTGVIKPQDFGIETKQAKELMSNLPQIKEEREVLEKQYKNVIKLDIENPDSWKKARELRLLIQKNRTQGINTWHKNAKDYFLKGGQFVDAIKRKEASVNERMESQLLEIEKYEEIKRKQEIERLNELRISEIEPYKEYVPFGIPLGELEEEAYQHLLKGAKLQHEAEEKRIKEEEEKRLEKERISKLHNERKDLLLDVWQFVGLKQANFGEMSDEDFEQILVNAEAAKKDHEETQRQIKEENERLEKQRIEREKKEKEKLAKIEEERKKEREEYLKKQKEAEEKARKEQEEREKIEAKLKKEEENKKRLAKIEEERVQKELNKNDSEKVKDLISDLENLKGKYTFKSKKNIKMYEDVSVLIQKVINHINK